MSSGVGSSSAGGGSPPAGGSVSAVGPAPASPAPYHRVYARPSGAGEAPFAWFMDAVLYRLDAPPGAPNNTGGLVSMGGSYRLGNPPGPTPSPAPGAGPVEGRAYLVGYREGRGDEVVVLCKEYGLEVVYAVDTKYIDP